MSARKKAPIATISPSPPVLGNPVATTPGAVPLSTTAPILPAQPPVPTVPTTALPIPSPPVPAISSPPTLQHVMKQPVPIQPLQPATQKMQMPLQPNPTSPQPLQTSFQAAPTIQTLNYQAQPQVQTIAPSQLLPSPSSQTPQTQKQLGGRTSKAKQQQQQTQKPRKQKQTKRTVKRATPAATTTQPILPRPAKGRAKITAEEIQLVQSLIERCLQLYMNQTEVITALHLQANIEPSFTSLVWLKLEEQNPDFFKAYHIRLRIKEQITAFNYLVSQQAQLMQKAGTFVQGLNQQLPGAPVGMQPALVGQPLTFGLPYAPLPQLPSLQALAAGQAAAAGISSTHPTPIAPRLSQPARGSPTLPSQGNGISSQPSSPFVSPLGAESLGYGFAATPGTSFSINEEPKDDTPITEDIDTNQFFLSES